MPSQGSKKPPFVTFYSFKGGVGRTMALVNVACILAGRGRRVLAIDMDLEAPGLTYLVSTKEWKFSKTPGFVDLIHDLLVKGLEAPIADKSQPLAFLEYTQEISVPKHAIKREGGILRIMPAGRMDGGYEDRLQAIDLGRLYGEGKGKPILKHVRNVIAISGLFDYVLIDSRTGFSDEAGICIRDLGDRLVVLLGLNRQNVAGTERFLTRLGRKEYRPSDVLFVASPIPIGEDQLRTERIDIADKSLSQAWGQPVKLHIALPYHPRLALDENPFLFQWSDTPLYGAYEKIEEEVRSFADDTTEEWLKRFQRALKDGKHEDALAGLEELRIFDPRLGLLVLNDVTEDSIGKDVFTPYFEMLNQEVGDDPEVMFRYGRHLSLIGRLDEGMVILENAKQKFQENGQTERVAKCQFFIGSLLAEQEDYDPRAEHYLEASLDFYLKAEYKVGIGANLRVLGQLFLKRGDEDKGLKNLHEAADTLKSINNPREAGLLQRAMAEHHKKKGNLSEALGILDEAKVTFEEMGKAGLGELAQVKDSMAGVHLSRGDLEQALLLFQENLLAKDKLGDRRGAAVTKHSIAEVYQQRGMYDEALALYEESLKVFEEIDDRRGIAATKHSMGVVYQLRGSSDEALTFYKESLKVFEEIGDRREGAVTRGYQGFALAFTGQIKEGEKLVDKAINNLAKLEAPEALARIYILKARLAALRKDASTALTALDKSSRLAGPLHAQHLLADISVLRAQLLPEISDAEQKDLEKALEYYRSQKIRTSESEAAEALLS